MKQNCIEALNQHAQPLDRKATLSNLLLLLLFLVPTGTKPQAGKLG